MNTLDIVMTAVAFGTPRLVVPRLGQDLLRDSKGGKERRNRPGVIRQEPGRRLATAYLWLSVYWHVGQYQVELSLGLPHSKGPLAAKYWKVPPGRAGGEAGQDGTGLGTFPEHWLPVVTIARTRVVGMPRV